VLVIITRHAGQQLRHARLCDHRQLCCWRLLLPLLRWAGRRWLWRCVLCLRRRPTLLLLCRS
jgi:hypothetical protein